MHWIKRCLCVCVQARLLLQAADRAHKHRKQPSGSGQPEGQRARIPFVWLPLLTADHRARMNDKGMNWRRSWPGRRVIVATFASVSGPATVALSPLLCALRLQPVTLWRACRRVTLARSTRQDNGNKRTPSGLWMELSSCVYNGCTRMEPGRPDGPLDGRPAGV